MLVIILMKAKIYCLINLDETTLCHRHLVQAITSLKFLVEEFVEEN